MSILLAIIGWIINLFTHRSQPSQETQEARQAGAATQIALDAAAAVSIDQKQASDVANAPTTQSGVINELDQGKF